MIILNSIVAVFLGIIHVVYAGTAITPENDRTVALERGKDTSFSWTFSPKADEMVVLLFLYNGNNNTENKLWSGIDKILPKGEEMFNGRLNVDYINQKELTVTIQNAMLNDSIRILLTGYFFNQNNPILSTKFNPSLTLDVHVNGGTTIPEDDRTFVLEKGKEKSFSWTLAHGVNEILGGLILYNGTNNQENKLWSIIDKMLPKGEEIFNGRLKVNYDGNEKKLTVTIEKAMLNESITILLIGAFLKSKDFTLSNKFSSSVTIDVQGGPELYKELNSSYNSSYNTNPSIKIGVAGKPKPSVQFSFDRHTTQGIGTPLTNGLKQYEFDLNLPQLTGRHCGTILSYTATSTLQNSSPVTGNTIIYVDDFPLHVTIDSFSYDGKIPTVRWQPVESGNCHVKYHIEISNQTHTITKESVEKSSLEIPEMTKPINAKITAIHGLRRGSISDSFTFTKTTTTYAPINNYKIITK